MERAEMRQFVDSFKPWLSENERNVKNAYETLMKKNPDVHSIQDLGYRLDTRFGSSSWAQAVPVMLNHSIGKGASSFPSMYLQGTYPVETAEGNVSPVFGTMLVDNVPNRVGIQNIERDIRPVKEYKDLKEYLQALKASSAKSSRQRVSALRLDPRRVKSYLQRVDAAGSVPDSALARLILDKTKSFDQDVLDQLMKVAWDQFVASGYLPYRNEPNHVYLLMTPAKIGSDQYLLSRLPLLEIPWRGIILAGETPDWSYLFPSKTTDAHIVIVDDMMYTGTQVTSGIEWLLWKELFGKETKHKAIPRLHFEVVVPLVTQIAEDLFHDIFQDLSYVPTAQASYHFYSLLKAESIQELVECEKKSLSRISDLAAARTGRFNLPGHCPTICSQTPTIRDRFHFPLCSGLS
jgi:hypothetical protein